jgi:LmbE family N-acetylglucosaminyl deacetylase
MSRRSIASALAALVACLAFIVAAPAARQAVPDSGLVGLQLLLRKLAVAGTVMHVTAHPDDENNALLAKQSHGDGLRVVLATATRGTGGQNEIGPELFDALGVLRTEELLAAHRYDGAEQRFARAVDFGYSFSIDESFEKWGRDAIVGDYVRLVRIIRPDVMVTMRPDIGGGGQHHQASALIGLEAFRAAGDAARYTEQLAEGLRAWQPAKIYTSAYYGFFRGEPKPDDFESLLAFDADTWDPLLGRTYNEIGSRARAMHKCQGFGQLLALPGPFVIRYRLADTTLAHQKSTPETSMLDGLDLSLPGLARRFAGASPPKRLTDTLAAIDASVKEAANRAASGRPEDASAPLAAGLTSTRELRGWLSGSGLSPDAAYEIDFRLARTESLFQDALAAAQGLRLEALSETGIVTPGQAVKLRIIAANRGGVPADLRRVVISGLQTTSACDAGPLAGGSVRNCELDATVPHDAALTEPHFRRSPEAARYIVEKDVPFGYPFRPTPFRARFEFVVAGAPVSVDQAIQYRYEGNIFSGEKRSELLVVPALSVRVEPEIAIVPSGAQAGERSRDVRVTVTSSAPQAVDAAVTVEAPHGWRVEPARHDVRFARPGEASTVRFSVRAPDAFTGGQQAITAVVSALGRRWTKGFDVVEYPHIRRRHIYAPSSTTVKAIDVNVPEGLRIGYVMGVGDQVPQAIEQLGADVRLLSAADLASGDLSQYDAIVTGVRAYERRGDLRAYNHRLIQYAEQGGVVLVQYNKFEFNAAQYGPYPVKVSSGRVTDETAPILMLVPDHPVFNTPNRIDERAWADWVQERGLYFLGERDDRYVDLLELTDPFPENAGPKRGALVEARVGRGRWVYVGLGLWRQLPAGTNGAYKLLANLLALGRAER